ncbi:MAG: TetR/AcrR family transcriptional regulator [Alistipes sp.]|nr:TetR/AcrR family transcriptional regulator [Alistipes sp.]
MKERIINCSIELFGRYGIKGVTMDAIASELRISKRTIYEHFTCKKQLLEECLHARLGQHQLLALTGKSLVDELVVLYAGMRRLDLDRAHHFCRELRKFYAPVYETFLRELLDYASAYGKHVEAGIREGYIRRDVQPVMVCTAVSGCLMQFFAYADYEYADVRRIPSPEIIIIFTRGLCTIKGRSYLEQKIKEIA